MDQHNNLIVFCDEDVPPQLFGDFCYTQDCRPFTGNPGCPDNNNESSDLKSSSAHSHSDPNNNNSEDDQSEMVVRERFHTGNVKSLLKSSQNSNNPGLSSSGNRNVRRKKSVSFDDDVLVYLFDQESPTLELHPEASTSLPSRCSHSLSDVTLEASGLEWEDDFSALEINCHFQCVRHPQRYTSSLPKQSWTSLSRPERFILPQTCLFLTHVTESDLEL